MSIGKYLALALFLLPPLAAAESPGEAIGSFRSGTQRVVVSGESPWWTMGLVPGARLEDVRAHWQQYEPGCTEIIFLPQRRILVMRCATAPAWMTEPRLPGSTSLHSFGLRWLMAGVQLPNQVPLGLSDEILVRTTSLSVEQRVEEIAREYGATRSASLPWGDGLVLHTPFPRRDSILALCRRLQQVSGVRDAYPNWIREKDRRMITNDPYLGDQWTLEHIGVFQAWNQTMGSPNVVVGVYDDGFDLQHEDLGADGRLRTEAMWDFAAGDNDPSGGEHGTPVAGIAVASADNGLGIAGVCPDCAWIPAKLGWTDADDIAAFKHFADWGAHVVNNSWGYNYPSSGVQNAIYQATVQGRGGLGTMVVFAAGNESVDIDEIQDISVSPGAIAVSAVSSKDELRSYSNYGSSVDLAAPADYQYSTDYTGGVGYDWGAYTTSFGGTSGAAPVVSGLAGLIFSVNPELTESDVRHILYDSALNLGQPALYGHGRVQAAVAVALAAGIEPGSLVGDDAPPPGIGGAPSNDPASCAGYCGAGAPAGCYCDAECVTHGDCCDDVCVSCGVGCDQNATPLPPPSAESDCVYFVKCTLQCVSAACAVGCALGISLDELGDGTDLIGCLFAQGCVLAGPGGLEACAQNACGDKLQACVGEPTSPTEPEAPGQGGGSEPPPPSSEQDPPERTPPGEETEGEEAPTPTEDENETSVEAAVDPPPSTGILLPDRQGERVRPGNQPPRALPRQHAEGCTAGARRSGQSDGMLWWSAFLLMWGLRRVCRLQRRGAPRR